MTPPVLRSGCIDDPLAHLIEPCLHPHRARLREVIDHLARVVLDAWIPTTDVLSDAGPDAWHPLDALFAPLHGPDGTLVGMLSVDLPHDGRRPGSLQRELLRMFAT